jgi:hypothetical protein
MDFPTTTTIAVAEVPVRTRVYVAAYAYARASTTAEVRVVYTAGDFYGGGRPPASIYHRKMTRR